MCLAGIRFTTHCNFKTYVNAPHVNIYHIESVSQENNHIIFLRYTDFFWVGGVGYIYIHYIPIYPRRYAPGYSLTTFCLESGSQYLSASNDPPEYSTRGCICCRRNDEVATRFEQLDADHNGVLSPEEVSAVLQDTLGLDPANASHMIQMFDTNRDGNLDKTEFMALWSSMFGP